MKAARAAVAGYLRSPPRRPSTSHEGIDQQIWNNASEAERWQILKERGGL